MENFFQKLCGKLTKHKHRECWAFSEEFIPHEYYCYCKICRFRFYTSNKPKNFKMSKYAEREQRMYKSPIEIMESDWMTEWAKDWNAKMEGEVMKAVKSYSISVDKEELLRALEHDRNQYEKGYEDGLKASKWIPCSERLPEDNVGEEQYQMCLVTLANGDVCLGVYRWDDLEWYTRMSEGEDDYSTIHEVIAWMPRPEPYRKEQLCQK